MLVMITHCEKCPALCLEYWILNTYLISRWIHTLKKFIGKKSAYEMINVSRTYIQGKMAQWTLLCI